MTTRKPSATQELFRRLEQEYKFECEGGALKNCLEWIAIKNSYETDQALIKQLTEALGNFECGECSHPLRLHLGRYGCEVERGDLEGDESGPAEALPPCSCKGAFPEDVAAIKALLAAKERQQ
jgi:hypothetical protein